MSNIVHCNSGLEAVDYSDNKDSPDPEHTDDLKAAFLEDKSQ
jgi:hypothetical protein